MSTPVTPSTPAPVTPVAVITKDLTWLKTHLVLLVIVVALAVGSVYAIEGLVAKHDIAQEARDQQLLTLVTSQTTDLKTRMAQDEQTAVQRDQQYATIISQLSGTISKQTGQLQQQVKQNATLNATQTARAITDKTKAQLGEVTAVGDNLTLDLPIARQINSDLDTLATTTLQLGETQKQLQAQTSLTTDAVLDATNAKKVIDSQDVQLKDAAKVCTDQINTVKAQARKSKIKWFFAGVLTGLGLAHPLGI